MISKITGILQAWQATANPVNMYHAQAPEGLQMPYIVFLIVGDVPQNETSNGQAYSKMLVQFSVFGTSDTQVLGLQENLETVFNLKQINIPATSAYPAISMQLKSNKIIKEDRLIWHGISEYLLLS